MRLQVSVSILFLTKLESEGEEDYLVPIMFGVSYGELFLLIGATAALVGPKDLPIIARTAGRLAGRAIGYVQLARGQFDSVMQQSQARQVHKELQDTLAQLEAIRYEIRSISIMNPGPMTRRLMEDFPRPDPNCKNGISSFDKGEEKQKSTDTLAKDYNYRPASSVNMHMQATAYARLAEAEGVKTAIFSNLTENEKPSVEAGNFPVLPVSAESTGFLPSRGGKLNMLSSGYGASECEWIRHCVGSSSRGRSSKKSQRFLFTA